MFLSSTTGVQYTTGSCLKTKVNLSATVFVDDSFASQHRKHWLVRYFWSSNFLSYGTNHHLLLKNNSSKTSSYYHYPSFPFASLPSTIFGVLVVVSKLPVAASLQDPRSTSYCMSSINTGGIKFLSTLQCHLWLWKLCIGLNIQFRRHCFKWSYCKIWHKCQWNYGSCLISIRILPCFMVSIAVPFKASASNQFRTTLSTFNSCKTGGFVYTVWTLVS